VKRIQPRRPEDPEEGAVAQPVGGFEALERRVDVPKPRVQHRECARGRLAARAQGFEFAQKLVRLVGPAQPRIHVPEVRHRQRFA